MTPSANGQVVLDGTFGSVYRGVSSRGRWGWQRVDRTQDAAVSAIVWLPWNPRRAFAAVFGVRPAVVSTQDGGRSWRPDVRGLPPTLPTRALLATSTPSHHLILTTMGSGVWRRDRTGTRQDMSAGLPARHAMPIVAVPGNGTAVLYAGAMGYGIYAKQGGSTWRRLGHGMICGRYTALGLAMALRPHPTLLVGTALGVFRYLPPHLHTARAFRRRGSR